MVNVKVTTVASIIKKFKDHGSVANISRCGCKRNIGPRLDGKIVRMVEKEP